jgi:hypothetical protein
LQAGLISIAVRYNYAGEADDLQANITDTLTDLRHLCDMENLDFYAMIESSYHHYLAETGQPGPLTD